jgi:hypothetical protein
MSTWRRPNGDYPIKIVGYLGKGPNGREYVRIEESNTGIPLDECHLLEDDDMPKTLWEMLKAKVAGPVELQITNPLKLKIGNTVRIDDIDLKDLSFNVKQIMEYKRTIGGQDFYFTDYDLLAHPLGGEDVKVRLRLNPMERPDKAAGLTHNVVMLRIYDEMAYDEGLYNVVTDTTKMFEVNQDGVCVERYYRINNVQDSYKPAVTVVKEGAKDMDDVQKVNIEYWDYWREEKDEGGTTFNQFLFVEMNKDDGWFQIWRGQEIDPQQISVY